MPVLTIDAIPPRDLAGQPVLVRIDSRDELRMREALPALALLSDARARVVIATHAGAPPDAPHLDALAAQLAEMLGRPVGPLDPWRGEAGQRAISQLAPGGILMLENLAFEPGEASGEESLAEALARLAAVFCNEAFALAHEVRASTVGVAKKVPNPVGGIAFGHDLNILEFVLNASSPPFLAVLGGELSKEKLLLAEEIAERSDETLVAGQLVLPFLVARGSLLRHVAVSDEMIIVADRMIVTARDKKHRLTTPVDFTVVDENDFERLQRGDFFARPPVRNVTESELAEGQVIADIGTATRWTWSDRFAPARTIFWHGPLGICEFELFSAGSRFLATELAERTWPTLHRTLVCGASLIDGLRRCGFVVERLRHVTRSGRPALYYRAGRPLPAVEVLRRSGASERSPACILIALNGSERDAVSLHAAAELTARDAELVLLHVRPGPDEEQYPDIALGLDRADRLERQIESERIFSRANAALASHGLLSHRQLAVQGRPTTMILRYAERLNADMIVMTATAGLAAHGWRRVVDHAPLAAMVARPH